MLAFNLGGVGVSGRKPNAVMLQLPVARHSVSQNRIFSCITNQPFYYGSPQNSGTAFLQSKIRDVSFKILVNNLKIDIILMFPQMSSDFTMR